MTQGVYMKLGGVAVDSLQREARARKRNHRYGYFTSVIFGKVVAVARKLLVRLNTLMQPFHQQQTPPVRANTTYKNTKDAESDIRLTHLLGVLRALARNCLSVLCDLCA